MRGLTGEPGDLVLWELTNDERAHDGPYVSRLSRMCEGHFLTVRTDDLNKRWDPRGTGEVAVSYRYIISITPAPLEVKP